MEAKRPDLQIGGIMIVHVGKVPSAFLLVITVGRLLRSRRISFEEICDGFKLEVGDRCLFYVSVGNCCLASRNSTDE